MGEPPKKSSTGLLVFLIILLVLVIAGGLGAFAYTQKMGPFKPKVLSEETFLPSILAKISEITSGSSKVKVNLNVGARDADAKPLVINKIDDPAVILKYENDATRAKNIQSIITALKFYKSQKSNVSKKFPTSLSVIRANSPNLVIKDPSTDAEYKYELTESGENFSLTFNFELDESAEQISRYGNSDDLVVVGKSITLNKDSYPYLYLSGKPPKTFLQGLGDSIVFMPPEINVIGELSVRSEWGQGKLTDSAINLNGEGSFGDLSYKVNADVMKKGEDYYFIVNNIPSLFLFGDIAALKGQWFRVSLKDIKDSTGFSMLDEFSEEIAKSEEYNQKFKELWVKIAEIAGVKQVLYFKAPPKQEKVDGQNLTRYELGVKKENLISFFERVSDEVKKDSAFSMFNRSIDDIIKSLKGQEFSDIFSYVDENAKFIVWLNSSGYPVLVRESFRLVPPEGVDQLAGKQVNLIFESSLSDINKPVEITAPADAKPLLEMINKSLGAAKGKSEDAMIKASLSMIRSQAELVYEDKLGYGKKAFALGACSKAPDTLFADEDVFTSLKAATSNKPESATCVSKLVAGKVDTYAVSAPLKTTPLSSWCVDSTGASKEIVGSIKEDKCE